MRNESEHARCVHAMKKKGPNPPFPFHKLKMVDSVGELLTKVSTSLIQVALQIFSILRRPPGQHQSQLGARLVATLRVLIVVDH